MKTYNVTVSLPGHKHDEFSCPCCGTPTDSAYCAEYSAAECGEQERDECRKPVRSYIGTCWEHCTMLDGAIRMCRMELWQVNGERQFGRILEVL